MSTQPTSEIELLASKEVEVDQLGLSSDGDTEYLVDSKLPQNRKGQLRNIVKQLQDTLKSCFPCLNNNSRISNTEEGETGGTIAVSLYGIILITFGGVIYSTCQRPDSRHVIEIFSTVIAAAGMGSLLFLYVNIPGCKPNAPQVQQVERDTRSSETKTFPFLGGRQCGNIYLNFVLAVFGGFHLLNETVMLTHEIKDFVHEDRLKLNCGSPSFLIHHITRIVYAGCQLFIILTVLRDPNISIKRGKSLTRWAFMHVIASCVCFWFGEILNEALEEYNHLENLNKTSSFKKKEMILIHFDYDGCSYLGKNSSACLCSSTTELSPFRPYLSPFSIEFNILLAGVWCVMLHNIGKKDPNSLSPTKPQHHNMDEKYSYTSSGGVLFGIFISVTELTSLVFFFESKTKYQKPWLWEIPNNILMYTIQECSLGIISLIFVLFGFRKLSKLQFSKHQAHVLDDVLMIVPLIFYVIEASMTLISEFNKKVYSVGLFMSLLIPVQVLFQTPFIYKGLRKCSNTKNLRFEKPGSEILVVLIICNLLIWFINSFETKGMVSFYGQHEHYGKFVWMLVSHVTLPFKLFYRIHSSICLFDIWKSAYNSGE